MTPKPASLAALLALCAAIASCAAPRLPPDTWVTRPQSPQFVAVRVEDVDVSVAWYRTALGVEVLDDTSADDGAWRIVNLRGNGLFVELIRDRRATRVERAQGLFKVGFGVDDVERVADRVERGVGERPRIVDDTRRGIRLVQLRDPEGNIVQLSSPLPGARR